MKKVLTFVAVAVLMTSVAAADINPSQSRVLNQGAASAVRANGTLGSLTIDAVQTAPLTVRLDASVTTQGGDGVPVQVTHSANTYTLDNQVWLYGQIYDSPWNGGCTFWTYLPGTDWCGIGEEFFLNSPTALGSFSMSFTTAVPTAMNYQTYVLARAGLTWITTGYDWFYTTQEISASAVETIYIDNVQPPTPTPGPTGGEPIPTMNWLGIMAMIAILAGVAVLLMVRSR